MKPILYCATLSLLVMACSNAGQNTTTNSDSAAAPDSGVIAPAPSAAAADTGVTGCYAFIGGRDTVQLQLEAKDGNVSGSLSYNLYEKDRNDGTIQGTVSGDRIIGYYLFRSEGMMSVRQEVFKVTNGKLIPGTGEMIQRNDSMFFKDPSALRFDDTRALAKKLCIT